ncbi:MAG TPA: YicC/YloC family endoribonuclease [Pyrinomonadaceae bacterium]|nr:YicC/YloC family endoribonuclease [Pyrinomonadaceae bacterium]
MKSMTGFGRGAASGDGYTVAVELKTVNNRYLDIHLRVGQELSSLEVDIRKRINARLSRGRVDVNINFDRTGATSTFEINQAFIAGYVDALRDIQRQFNLSGDIDVNAIARLPGALSTARDDLNEDKVKGIEKAIDQALDNLEEMRRVEGASLAAEMTARLQKIEATVPVIEAAAGGLVETYRQRLQKRIAEMIARGGQTVELDAGRLAQEVAYLADRSDITEELARLKSHVEQFHSTIASSGEVGKRLDFLLQELNREANTVLSKSTDIAIKDAALAIKGEVEKLREQVQNVE